MLLNKRIPFGYLLQKIRPELTIVILYAAVIQVADEYFGVLNLALPIALPSLLGTAISLILAFRIGQSYDRWWEARKIWGAIVNDSRTIVRQALTLAQNKRGSLEKEQRLFAYRQIAWCYALGESLRGFDPHADMENYLPEDELEFLKKHDNVPNALLLLHSLDIERWHNKELLNDFQQIQLDSTVGRLTDWMGKSERIKNTVFPKQYSLLVEFLLYLFVVLLPFGLVEYFHYFEGLLTVVICTPFFMLEKTALHLQDPFENKPTDVAVTDIAQSIEMNIRQMMDENFSKIGQPSKFYLM